MEQSQFQLNQSNCQLQVRGISRRKARPRFCGPHPFSSIAHSAFQLDLCQRPRPKAPICRFWVCLRPLPSLEESPPPQAALHCAALDGARPSRDARLPVGTKPRVLRLPPGTIEGAIQDSVQVLGAFGIRKKLKRGMVRRSRKAMLPSSYLMTCKLQHSS